MSEWWESDEWRPKPMDFGKAPKLGPFRRVALTTDPEMVRANNGALRLRLVNRHPHEALRIYCGNRQALRA